MSAFLINVLVCLMYTQMNSERWEGKRFTRVQHKCPPLQKPFPCNTNCVLSPLGARSRSWVCARVFILRAAPIVRACKRGRPNFKGHLVFPGSRVFGSLCQLSVRVQICSVLAKRLSDDGVLCLFRTISECR